MKDRGLGDTIDRFTSATGIKRLSKLINYNDWKNKKTFDFIEIIVLSDIAYYEAEVGKEDTLPLLYNMLENDDWIYISSRSRDVIPALYFRVTQLLAMKEKYDEVLRLAEKGIKFFKRLLRDVDIKRYTQ